MNMMGRRLPRQAVSVFAAAGLAGLATVPALADKSSTFGSTFETTTSGSCSDTICTVKFSLLDKDELVTNASCFVSWRYDNDSNSVIFGYLDSKPAAVRSYLELPYRTVTATNNASIRINQAVEQIFKVGTNPTVQLQFYSAPAAATVTCTLAGTTKQP